MVSTKYDHKKIEIGKYEYGRDNFLKACWNWLHEYSQNIREQWAKLGLFLDDRKESIYQGEKIINWDLKFLIGSVNDIHFVGTPKFNIFNMEENCYVR